MEASCKIDRRTLVRSILVGTAFCFGDSVSSVRAQAGNDGSVLKGHVIYRERMALPSSAVVEVKLVDVSRADASSATIAKQKIEEVTGSPIPFELRFKSSLIQSGHSYALQARISVGDKLLFISGSRHPVLNGEPGNTDILVEKVGGGPQTQEKPTGKWLAEDILGGGVIDRMKSVLEIGSDGAVQGNGGCNRFTGHARIDGNSIIFAPLASTNMACTPAAMDQERKFHMALAATQRFNMLLSERKLLLLDAHAIVVLRLAKV
ncbi:META domain-containing protein [Mesorhizobium sp. DCY119]|nr:META domain-containing protein [Mesorhizobium sp. DCY119]